MHFSFFSRPEHIGVVFHFSAVSYFSQQVVQEAKNELEQPLWFWVVLPLGVEVSSRDFFLLPLRAARGLFPHSGGWPAWCVSWVWPLVPCSNGQNLQNQHAQLDKVGRIIHLSLVWAPLVRGRGLELIAALHRVFFVATFSLLAFAPWATLNCGLMPELTFLFSKICRWHSRASRSHLCGAASHTGCDLWYFGSWLANGSFHGATGCGSAPHSVKIPRTLKILRK